MSRPGEGQEGGREHSPSSLTPVTVRDAERSYPRRGYRFLPKGKYRSFTDFFPKREIPGHSPCFSFPAKAAEKGTKDRFFPAGFFCGPHIFYAPAVIAAGGHPHGGRGIIAPSARIRPAHHPQKNEGKQCRPPVSQPPNRPSRIHTGARQSPDEKGRPENKPIRLPSGHHPLSARHPRHQSLSRNQSRRASMQLSPPRSHPRRKAGPSHRRGRSRFRGSEPAPLRPLQGVLPCLVGFVAPNALQFR